MYATPRNGRVYIYYRNEEGRLRQVPRAEITHLDAAPAHAVQAWIAANAPKYEGSRRLSDDAQLYSDDALSKNVDAFGKYLQASEGRAKQTATNRMSWLRRYVIPYFLSRDPPLKDPNSWPGASIRMFEYLSTERGCSDDLIREINNAARKFFAFLKDEGVVAGGLELRLRRAARVTAETPLAYALTPEAVLDWARAATDPALRWLALTGYFFSLRPQEAFVLRASDFLAGSAVDELDRARAMRDASLFARLAVEVRRQRSNDGTQGEPKSHSRGWVVCFHAAAAEEIVGMLNALPDLEASFLTLKNRELYKRWRTGGIGSRPAGADGVTKARHATVTLKDLRRASIYWLGHNTALRPLDLMKHARHKHFSTTEKYLRQPGQTVVRKPGKFDLGA